MKRITITIWATLVMLMSANYLLKAESTASVLMENFKTAVAARQSGTVDLYVNEGGQLKSGDKICEVNAKKFQLRMKLADLKYRQAALSFKIAQIKYQRKKELFEAGGISEDAFELLRMEHELSAPQSNEGDITLAQMDLEEKQLEKELLKLEIHNAIYKAPASGQVVKLHVRDKQWVVAGQKLYDFLSIEPLFVALNIPLKQLSKIKTEMVLTLDIDSGNGIIKATGTVDYMIDELDTVDQNARILIRIQNENKLLKPGMRVKVNLP